MNAIAGIGRGRGTEQGFHPGATFDPARIFAFQTPAFIAFGTRSCTEL